MPSRNHTADWRPPFTEIRALYWARAGAVLFGILLALLALTGIGSDGAGFGFGLIAFIFIGIFPFVLSLRQLTRGLQDWHFLGTPDAAIPPEPTQARSFVRRSIRVLAIATIALAFLGTLVFRFTAMPGLGIALVIAALAGAVYLATCWLALPMGTMSRSRNRKFQNFSDDHHRMLRRNRSIRKLLG